jgi:hypothetical protein
VPPPSPPVPLDAVDVEEVGESMGSSLQADARPTVIRNGAKIRARAVRITKFSGFKYPSRRGAY